MADPEFTTFLKSLIGMPSRLSDTTLLNEEDVKNLIRQLTSGGETDYSTWLGRSSDLSSTLTGALSGLLGGTTATEAATQAGGLADKALSKYGQTYSDLAKQQSNEAVRQLEASMGKGGLFSTSSGAAAKSLASGAVTPLLEAQTAIAGKKADTYTKLFEDLLGSQQTALSTGTSLLGTESGTAANLLSALAAMSEPAYESAQYSQGGSSLLTSLLGAAAGSDWFGKLLGIV